MALSLELVPLQYSAILSKVVMPNTIASAKIGDDAASAVEQRVLGWCRSHEGASVAEKREAAKLIMEGFVQAYDDKAAEFASQWYDYRAEQGGARLKQAVTMTVYEPGSVDDVARYQAKKLAKEGDAAFARACGEFARNDAFRSLNETIIANVGRDRDKGAMFARVPTGAETCTFCLMLASRGAVYHTRKSAGEFKHFHRHCDCKVVPGFEDNPDAELVEGVKPRELYERYKQFKEIDETEGLSAADKDARKRAIAANPLLGTRADPALEYFGPAELDDPERLDEIKSWLKDNGFVIKVSSRDRERIGYSPENKAGDKGQVIVTEGMSLSAWLHETDHAKFDLENGLPGLMAYLADYKLREEMERRAYGVEISIAEEAGYNDLVARLQDLLKEEIDRLEADFGSV